jgi:hypothetical protein
VMNSAVTLPLCVQNLIDLFSLAYEKTKRRSSSTSKPIEPKLNLNGSGSRQTSRNRHRS